jgi:queuine/archaeosine tRNA-ribosyltransferase
VTAMRAAIAEGRFGAFRARFLERYGVESRVDSEANTLDREA